MGEGLILDLGVHCVVNSEIFGIGSRQLICKKNEV